ncbi:MAG: DUF6172 family protein [Rhodoferax sp.]|nr:DUF6172 family protein [Rhodoferax sp.]
MKKTFPLSIEGKHRDRVVDAVKHEIRKYVRRERRRALPEGVDFWDFECKFGPSEVAAERVHFATITACINAAVQENATQLYIEIVARPGVRKARLSP